MPNKKPIIGKFILDTLSVGMYNHPLMLIREYIQNSADAIDEICSKGLLKREDAKIEIIIDGKERKLTISDNGIGVKAENIWSILFDLGNSAKNIVSNRGFRGIGRLGGLGYCDKLIFKTKYKNEKHYSECVWDCIKLKQLINEKNSLDVIEIIQQVATLNESVAEDYEDHYFIVEMHRVKSVRDILLDVPAIKDYVSQIAPVPFNSNEFSFANLIDTTLRSSVPKYETYNIFINGEQLFKPYKDDVIISDKHRDRISNITFIKLENSIPLAYGWIGDVALLGAIKGINNVDGLRVRHGNILIGDKYLLADFYRERRFNGYLIGEIYTLDHKLIPNSRRDDFEDSSFKEEFYNCFIKKIGLPYSRKIREASLIRSQKNKELLENNIFETARKIINHGYISEAQKKKIIEEIKQVNEKNKNFTDENIKDVILSIINSSNILDHLDKQLSPSNKNLLISIFDVIYKMSANKKEAEKIIDKILDITLNNSKVEES